MLTVRKQQGSKSPCPWGTLTLAPTQEQDETDGQREDTAQESVGFKLKAWVTEEEGLGEVSGGEVQRETGGSP